MSNVDYDRIIHDSANKGVLLLQMGGPDKLGSNNLEIVESFLFNLFNDEYIIQLPFLLKPFQSVLARAIAKSRAPEVSKLYAKIGGGSPIRFETECQAEALERRLNAASGYGNNQNINIKKNDNGNKQYKVYVAMRYSNPFLQETLRKMLEDNIKELIVIPLYPQYSLATSGSSMIECKKLFTKSSFVKQANIKYIESWYDNEYFIQLIVRRIQDKLEEFAQGGYSDPNKVYILFSAHGLPEKYILRGDPYQEQVKRSVELVMGRFPLHRHMICYQSRVGPVKWLRPSTEQAIKIIAKEKNIKNLLVVPISFVGDHIETLYEIDILYREFARSLGIRNFKVTRLPKANKLMIKALESMV